MGGIGIRGVHHVAAICSDYELSKRFYVGTLGLRVVAETWRPESGSWKLDLAVDYSGSPGANAPAATIPGAYALELFWFGDRPPRPDRPEALGLRHLAFAVEDAAAARSCLEAEGVEVEPLRVDPGTGKRFAFFKDPDGLPLEIYEAG
ncbi:MAG: VOC family protein [Spirochaetes bacterium]|nr:VOC family protein [Spirochaetota bacterium]MBU1081499.1 VOC family protein [Spirochaetota bacterium]